MTGTKRTQGKKVVFYLGGGEETILGQIGSRRRGKEKRKHTKKGARHGQGLISYRGAKWERNPERKVRFVSLQKWAASGEKPEE